LTGLLYIWITHSSAAAYSIGPIVIAFLGKQGDIQGLTMASVVSTQNIHTHKNSERDFDWV
jgi:hypothetical protein